jgi:hypothetical protein
MFILTVPLPYRVKSPFQVMIFRSSGEAGLHAARLKDTLSFSSPVCYRMLHQALQRILKSAFPRSIMHNTMTV